VAEGGKIVAMSLSEKLGAGLVSQEEYAAGMAMEAAAARKAEMLALLAVKKQPGWPLEVEWPEADGD
jgi:hypothetical protein